MKHTVRLADGRIVPAIGLGTWYLGENPASWHRELEALRTNPLPKDLWYAETNLRESTDKAQRTQARLNRSLKLSSNNAISKREFEDAEIENIKAQGELARARENLEMVQRGVGERNIEKAERDIDLVEAKIASRRAALKLVERRIRECRIVAPSDGRLVTIPCKYSTYVQKGELAARMSAGTTLKGIAYVDETVVRKVRIGQSVRISSGVFNRLEYGSFYGSVDRVYDTPIQDPDTKEITYNLAQQDMIALRIVFRMGWALPNPATRMNEDRTGCAFAYIEPGTPVTTQAVTITVQDNDSTAIEGARVNVDGAILKTNASGQAVFNLRAGTYTAKISARGYVGATQTINVASSAVPLTVKLTAQE